MQHHGMLFGAHVRAFATRGAISWRAFAVFRQQTAALFWIGWEGAVLRAKLERRAEPLEIFSLGFFDGLRAA